MSEATLQDRVETLEKRVADLATAFSRTGRVKDWRETFGMSRDDPGFDEMVRLGRQYRTEDQEGSD